MSYKWPGIPNGDYSFDHGRAVWNKIINFLRRLCEKLDGDLVDATSDRRGLMTAADKATFDAIPDTYALRTGTLANNPIIRISADERVASFMQHGYPADSEIVDIGWDWNNRDGSVLGLRSSSHPTQPGYFQLTARDETDSTTLQGTPAGDLTWGGHKVITVADTATSTTAGAMSAEDKSKLDGVTAGAEPNQNAYSKIKVGSTTVAADAKTDTLELAEGTGITLTPDATNDKVTIAVTSGVYADASHTHNNYVSKTGDTMTGMLVVPAIRSQSAGSVQTKATGGYTGLVIKDASASADSTPNNGMVIEIYKNNSNYAGQLFLGDNATQGLYWNGWSSGTYGVWKKFIMTSDATYTVGSTTKPVYVNNGAVAACTYELNATVPANAKFTDTVTTVTTSGTGNAITSITASNGELTVKKDNTFSLSDHTHNYAGSSSAGGAANSLLNFTSGLNGVAEHNANNITTNGHWYYTSNGPATSLGASVNDGALYSQAFNANWVAQIAQDYRNGNLFVRGRNNGAWQAWRAVLTTEFGNAVSASKLQTARTITLGNQFQGSASFDGSSNITIDGLPYCATIGIGNTNNFPYHYIGTTGVLASTYQECLLTLLVTVGHNYNCCGICHIKVRTDVSGTNSSCAVRWIVRDSNMPVDIIQIGFRSVFGSTIADLFYKSSGIYQSGKVQVLESGYATGWNRCFTLYASSEANNTTASNKGSSFNSYASLTEAQNTLHSSQPYTHTVIAKDVGIVSSASSANNATKAANGAEIGMSSGITYTMYTTQCAGYVTANQKSLYFTIPIQRMFPDIAWNASNPVVNLTLVTIYKAAGGTINGLTGATIESGYCAGGIRVHISYANALSITNNSAVTVTIQGSIRFN